MKQLTSILSENCSLVAGEDKLVSAIAFDSRLIKGDDLFIAVKGVFVDGHDYMDKAIANGAIAIVCEVLPVVQAPSVSYILSTDSKQALADIAKNWYGDPTKGFKLVGIGGTNGKTTIATLLFELFVGLGYKTGLISTVDYRYGDKVFNSTHTTPDILSLNRILAEMRDEGCDYVFMEVSSHAIHQDRLNGLAFDGGVFSNITPEHMDYHETFKEYIYVKKSFYDNLSKDAFVLTNIDDKNGLVMTQNAKANKYTYALKRPASYKAKVISNTISGLMMKVEGVETYFRLPGWYNGYNLLAVFGVADLLGARNTHEVLAIMSNLSGAEGRFDIVRGASGVTAVVDYAHTPDALSKVIGAINDLKPKGAKLISVFGCGGDRDKTKRPVMAGIGSSESDIAIFTSDNPRTENPEDIIDEMELGVKEAFQERVLCISNRKQAIRTAVKMANKHDIILVAGKGHEKYQDVNGVKTPFDDKNILKNLLINS